MGFDKKPSVCSGSHGTSVAWLYSISIYATVQWSLKLYHCFTVVLLDNRHTQQNNGGKNQA